MKNLIGKSKGKHHLEDLEIDGGTILRWMLKKKLF
jgi:hypothetical protein